MSGDVSVDVVRGSLVIRGDEQANNVVIDQAGLAAGQLRLTGRDGTKINGQDEWIVDGVTRDIRARLGDGDDVLELTGVAVGRDLIVRGQDGGDSLLVTDGSVGRDVIFRAGDGDNTTTIDGTAVSGRIVVLGGRGADVLNVTGDASAAGIVEFRPGRGESTCTISQATIGDLTVNGRGGATTIRIGDFAEVLGAVNVFCGSDIADIRVENSTFQGNVRVKTGKGDDTVRIENSYFGGSAAFSTGDGADRLVIEGEDNEGQDTVFVGVSSIRLGRGNDLIEIASGITNRVQFSGLTIDGGHGTDSFYFDPNVQDDITKAISIENWHGEVVLP